MKIRVCKPLLMLAILIGSVWHSSNALAQSRIDSSGYLRFPYDGVVSPSDLKSKGHDMNVIFDELIRLNSPLQKDEFETTLNFKERSAFSKRIEDFKTIFGDNFLYIDYLRDANSQLRFDADKSEMIFLFSPPDIIFYPNKSYVFGKYGRLQFNSYESLFKTGRSCLIEKSVRMSTDEARGIKESKYLRLAVLFDIEFTQPKYYRMESYDSKIGVSTRKYYDYSGYKKILSYWDNALKEYENWYVNWRNLDLIIFNIQSGEIIYRNNCRADLKL